MVAGLGVASALVPVRYSVNGVSRCTRNDGRTLVVDSSMTGESLISLTGRPLTCTAVGRQYAGLKSDCLLELL
jgi:hypothetical protein